MDRYLMNACYLVACIGVYMNGILGHSHSSSEEKITTTAVTGSTAGCPEGFLSFESSCYRLVSDPPINGFTARNECQKLANDSHLAFIQSQSEMTFLKELAIDRGLKRSYWFGLTYTNDTDNAHWLDGSALGDFTAWDRYGAFDERHPCVRLRWQSDYLWNDRNCDHYYYGYICEVERSTDDVTPMTKPSPVAGSTDDVTPMTTPSPKADSPAVPPPPTEKSAGFKSGPTNMAAPIDNHLQQSLQVPSLVRCALHCLKHNACVGFNFQLEAVSKLLRVCELLSKQFSDEEFVQRRGFKYYRV